MSKHQNPTPNQDQPKQTQREKSQQQLEPARKAQCDRCDYKAQESPQRCNQQEELLEEKKEP
jgi:hypothetical protein